MPIVDASLSGTWFSRVVDLEENCELQVGRRIGREEVQNHLGSSLERKHLNTGSGRRCDVSGSCTCGDLILDVALRLEYLIASDFPLPVGMGY